MSAPILGGLPLSRMTYALVVGAAGLLWSTLYVVAMWEGIRATFSRVPVDGVRSRTVDPARTRAVARHSLEDRAGAWDDDGGRIVDEPALYRHLSPESKVRHAAFR